MSHKYTVADLETYSINLDQVISSVVTALSLSACISDGSDWDSASTASKASPSYRLDEEPERETSSMPVLPALQEQETGPLGSGEVHRSLTPEKRGASPSATSPLPSPRLRSTLSPLLPQQLHTQQPASPKPKSEEGEDGLM